MTQYRCGNIATGIADSLPNHEAQAEAWIAASVRQTQVPRAQRYRATIRLAEGASPLGDTRLQAREKLCRHGHVGLLAAVSTTVLFVRCQIHRLDPIEI